MDSTTIGTAFTTWLDQHMRIGSGDKSSRIVTVLGLLERLQDSPGLERSVHLAKSNAQLIEHNNYVKRALERSRVETAVQEYGRRANNVAAWIDPLFDWLRSNRFVAMSAASRQALLQSLQDVAANRLRVINEDKPLVARFSKGTANAIIFDLLEQAQQKKRAKDVAEYLVGAKLQQRFGDDAVTPKNVNAPNRKGFADFEVGNASFEVTINPPDTRHIDQIRRILKNTGRHIWLLVRSNEREKWQVLIDVSFSQQSLADRVVVADIETFVGQNISEMGRFLTTDVAACLGKLFEKYNEKWLPKIGTGGIRIVSSEPDAV